MWLEVMGGYAAVFAERHEHSVMTTLMDAEYNTVLALFVFYVV